MYQLSLIPALRVQCFSKSSQSPQYLKFILLSNLLEFPIIFVLCYYLISIISLIYILIFFFNWTVSRVLFTFLFLRRKSGLALRRMGFKVPFCRYQVVRKRWVQVQGKTLHSGLILCFYHRRNFSPVSAAEGTFLQFLPQDWLFCYAAKLSAVQ